MHTHDKASKRKVVAIIQARMGSTRLPGKMILPLAGRPMLWHVIQRAKKLQTPDEIILATTTHERDDVLVKVAEKEGVSVFRGSEDDVLGRFLGAAAQTHADIILRICADTPLFDIGTADSLVRELKAAPVDAVFAHKETLHAIGGFEAFTHDALQRVAALTSDPYDTFAREHVSVYLGLHPRYYPEHNKNFTRRIIPPREVFDITHMRIAVDTQEDYEFMQRIYDQFYCEGEIIPLETVVAFLNKQSSGD